jgi:hypothetical protein
MLTDLDETLKQLLVRELPIPNGEVEVSFDQPKRDWAAGRVKPTVNFFAYDVHENADLRRTEWVVERDENGQASKHQPPRRFNVTYMVTSWAGAVEDEHRLFWRVLAVLLRLPELSPELLQGELSKVKEALPTTVLGIEEIPNPSDLWSALENELRPAIHYRVVLPLDVAQRFVGPLVFTKRILVEQGLEGQGPFEEIVQIAGTVRDGEKNPVAEAEVRVPEAGLTTQTDAEGRYTFPNVAPGTYTFAVAAPGQKAREHKVTVPSPHYDLRI